MSTTKKGNIILSDVSVPDTANPGESISLQATVENGATYINPFDPDKCGGSHEGYEVRMAFEMPDGTTYETDTECIKMSVVGTGEYTFRQPVTAPSTPGTYRVEAWAKLPGSGKETPREYDTLTISEDAPRQPEDSTGGGSGTDTDSPFGGGGSSGQINAALGVLALLALAWMADSGSKVVG